MAPDQRRVDVERGLRGPDAELPRALACPCAGGAHRFEQRRLRGDPVEHPKRRRVGGHPPEQRLLISDRAQIAKAVAAVGEHHRQVAHHPTRIVTAGALAHPGQAVRQRPREPCLVGHLRQQRAARVRDQPVSVRRDFYGETAAITLHPQGDPPEPGLRPSNSRILPAQPDIPAPRLRPGRGRYCTIRARLVQV
jgi:hypothetical protein